MAPRLLGGLLHLTGISTRRLNQRLRPSQLKTCISVLSLAHVIKGFVIPTKPFVKIEIKNILLQPQNV